MTPEEFRRLGHQIVDWIADFRRDIDTYPVRSEVEPGWVKEQLAGRPPERPESPDALLDDLNRVIVPGVSHFQHPRYFAFYPANASLASALGDLVSTGLGTVGLNWEAAPALTELEELTCDWMRELLGLDPAWRGSIHDTASTACFVSALCARERASDYAFDRTGFGDGPPQVMYTSAQAHSSVPKAILLAGVGRERMRLIDVDSAYRLDANALERQMKRDREAGLRPSAVFASVGATGAASVDPVADIVDIAREYEAWVHVDAAMAGSAMILEECRHLWAGAEHADSISLNVHKWMGTVFDCSLLYMRDIDHLVKVMSTDPSYLKTHRAEDVTQFRNWGLPLGRRFRALKMWFHLRLDGATAIRARLRRDLENTEWLAKQIEATDDWYLTAPAMLQTLCMRHEPGGEGTLTREQRDAHTLAWVEALNRSGRAYLTPTVLDGAWTGRVSIGAEATEREHVKALWTQMQQAAAGAAAE